MPFVQRNEAGVITGQFANRQPGFGEEWLPEDSPELSYVSPAQLADLEREWRDGELAAVKWLRERHRDQVEIAFPTTLTGQQFVELLTYMQELRDWPQATDFPDSQNRPVAPQWVAEQAE